MTTATGALLLCAVILIAAHHSLAQSGGAIIPVRHNPLVISGVGPECPEDLDSATREIETETLDLLESVVGQIECTYLGNC